MAPKVDPYQYASKRDRSRNAAGIDANHNDAQTTLDRLPVGHDCTENAAVLYSASMIDDVAQFLSEKVGEYQVLAGPLQRAARELDLSHQMLRAKVESEIIDEIPALGTLADVLDISILDMLMAPNRYDFVNQALTRSGMTSQELLQQLRALGPPPRPEDLGALGLESA